MGAIIFFLDLATVTCPKWPHISYPKCPFVITRVPLNLPFLPPPKRPFGRPTIVRPLSPCNAQRSEEDDPQQPLVQDLRVPDLWLQPSRALQESEWLRLSLHKWLDDEYCPEPTNIEISKVAARSYYESLIGKQSDLGEILLKMARDLESISYKESFHGAFSSANAAVNLITARIASQQQL